MDLPEGCVRPMTDGEYAQVQAMLPPSRKCPERQRSSTWGLDSTSRTTLPCAIEMYRVAGAMAQCVSMVYGPPVVASECQDARARPWTGEKGEREVWLLLALRAPAPNPATRPSTLARSIRREQTRAQIRGGVYSAVWCIACIAVYCMGCMAAVWTVYYQYERR